MRLRAASPAARRDLSHTVAAIRDTAMIANAMSPATAGRAQTSLSLPSESIPCHQKAGGWVAPEIAFSPKTRPALGTGGPCGLKRAVMLPGLAVNCCVRGAAQQAIPAITPAMAHQ